MGTDMARVEQSYGGHTKAIDKNGKYTSVEIPYIVFDAADEDAALSAVFAAAPKTSNSLPLDSIEIDSRENETTFKVNAVYKTGTASSSASDSNEAQMSFDLSTGSETVKRTLNQRWKSANARATGGYIGWDGKSTDIAGVTVVTGVMRESYTLYWKPAKLDNDYRRALAVQVGRVNSKAFKGWNKGEALFLGATFSGNASGSEKVPVTYNFAIQQNEAATTVNGIAVPAKYGWEYVWSIAATKVPAGGIPTVVVDGIYFEQVYKWGDFGRLKI